MHFIGYFSISFLGQTNRTGNFPTLCIMCMNNYCGKGISLNSSTKCHLNTLEHNATFDIFHKKYFSAMKPYLEELCVKDRT